MGFLRSCVEPIPLAPCAMRNASGAWNPPGPAAFVMFARLWRVNDQRRAELMRNFSRALAAKPGDYSGALRQAQLTIFAGANSHP